MSTDTSTTETAAVTYEKGTWQEKMNRSAVIIEKTVKAKKTAGILLWTGAVEGINAWLPSSATDVSAEAFGNEVLTVLGTSRKGDASKIKTVALAVRNNGLILADYPNLSKAYAEATRLTKGLKQEAAEDIAAEEAIASIVAPKTATTQESAAALLLSKGIDGAVVAILDALGKDSFEVHRSFLRAVSTEINSRQQATKNAEIAAKKAISDKAAADKAAAAAAKAAKGPAKKTAAPKAASTKAKPAPKSATKGDANKRMLPTPNAATKAKPAAAAKAKPAPVSEPVEDAVIEGTEVEAPVAAKGQPVRRAVPRRA